MRQKPVDSAYYYIGSASPKDMKTKREAFLLSTGKVIVPDLPLVERIINMKVGKKKARREIHGGDCLVVKRRISTPGTGSFKVLDFFVSSGMFFARRDEKRVPLM